MTPDINFESLSYNPFSIWENSINSEYYPDINFYQDSSSLETHYWSLNDFNFKFSIVCFSETRVDDIIFQQKFESSTFRLWGPTSNKKNCKGGGVCVFVHENLSFKLREDLNLNWCNSVSIEKSGTKSKNIVAGDLHVSL